MGKGLVIVESPTKAKTIGGILGSGYRVMATMGHVRDLPKNKLGIDIEKQFKPEYEIIPGKKNMVSKLRKAAAESEEVYLATDEDREGEAIAWHIMNAIGKDTGDVKRVAFHEIIPEAVKKAFKSPRNISLDLVNSQQARRILDRIVGYTMSPFLAKHLERGLSAGRVQSVALRLIVEREKEIEAFVPLDYWIIKADALKNGKNIMLTLEGIDSKKIDRHFFKNAGEVDRIIGELSGGKLTVTEKKEQVKKIRPYPPFITSTLQQEASIKLGFSSSKTMFNAQQLYEGIEMGGKNVGLITYMRTDSPSVAKSALSQAVKYIEESFGKEFLPPKPFAYRSKSSSAQEAHEAIRPTSVDMTPDRVKDRLTAEQWKLYTLIWKRFVASQMKEAEIKNIRLAAENGKYRFTAENNSVLFEGFTKLWEVKTDAGEEGVPFLEEGETISVSQYLKEAHTTNPPPRYTEASLIKTLEKFGIGRPSTYAPTLSILFYRGYVKREKRTLVPLKMGRVVYEILMEHFSEIINTDFTARMEEDLDKIVEGNTEWIALMEKFYGEYKPMLDKATESIAEDREKIEQMLVNDKTCPNCGIPLGVKKGKFGIFLACPNFPDCKYTERIKENVNYPRNRYKKGQGGKAL